MGITATQNLHYPDSTDFVEDHAANLETLARQLDARMRAHDLDVARIGEGRPFCVIDRVAPQILTLTADNSTATITFDTVRADTDNMAQLDVLGQAIFINTPGYYHLGFYAIVAGTGCVAGTGAMLWTAGTSPNGSWTPIISGRVIEQTDGGNGVLPGSGSYYGNARTPLPQAWGWVRPFATGTNCATSWTTTFARLWAYKVRDL